MQILVLGMHRSGTSAVGRILNLMGCYFGAEGKSIGFNEENPKGFWERLDVNEINRSILRSYNSDWYQLSDFPERLSKKDLDLGIDLEKKLKSTIFEMDAFRPWFIKDPRMCFTLPFWMQFLERPLLVYVYRNPYEVAKSLQKRGGFPIEFGLALWKAYNRQAFMNHSCQDIFAINYNELMTSSERVCQDLYSWLSLKTQGRVSEINDQDLQEFLLDDLYRERQVAKFEMPGRHDEIYHDLKSQNDLSQVDFLFDDADRNILKKYEKDFVSFSLREEPIAQEKPLANIKEKPEVPPLKQTKNWRLKGEMDQMRFQINQLRRELDEMALLVSGTEKNVDSKVEVISDINSSVDGQTKTEELSLKLNEHEEAMDRLHERLDGCLDQLSGSGQEFKIEGLAKNLYDYFSGKWYSKLFTWGKLFLGFEPKPPHEWVYMIERSHLFDQRYYLSQEPNAFKNPILHYVLVGVRTGLNPNPHFDTNFYIQRNKDVAALGLNPLLHYIEYGAEEGRSTSVTFNTDRYLSLNPDVKNYRLTPLAHYLKCGIREGRKTGLEPEGRVGDQSSQIKAPPIHKIKEMSSKIDSTADIDVIIPVYLGYDDTLNAICRVLESECSTKFNLIVINDATPDPRLKFALEELSESKLFEYIENKSNLGFVKTVNIGMASHQDRDVLLLNSDTEVYGDWLDRMRHQVMIHEADTVTPWSNNATICSYPRWPHPNRDALEIPYSEVDELFSDLFSGECLEIPTGVGFCMYISRKCLKKIGYFNEEVFERGYGEENDFCMRVKAQGGKNILALDVFVRHTGEVSFGVGSDDDKARALEALHRLHPKFSHSIQNFIESDPGKEHRQEADLLRLLKRAGGDSNVLYFTHSWGGGVERNLRDIIEERRKSRIGGFVCLPDSQAEESWGINAIDPIDVPNLKGLSFEKLDVAINCLRRLKVSHVELHSLAGWDNRVVGKFRSWANSVGMKYDVMLHDYLSVCPNFTLLNQSGDICKGLEVCHCHRKLGGKDKLIQYRSDYRELLEGSRRVVAPSNDAAKRIKSYFPDLKVEVVPHEEKNLKDVPSCAKEFKPGDVLSVGIIGAIGPPKGSRVIYECAKYALSQEMKVHFTIIGVTDVERMEELPNVTVTGRYREDEVYDLIRDHRLHVAFLSSICPETYCYTLSIVMRSHLPVALFDIGAQLERTEGYRRVVLEIGKRNDPRYIIEKLFSVVGETLS